MLYLNQINWRLKEFKHTSNEKIFISFVVSQIEFKTSIEINNLDSLSGLNYSVSKHGEGMGKRSEAIGDLYVRLDKISYTEEPRLINFSALNIFFQRIFSLNLHTELTRNDSKVINDLMDGIAGGIKNEFDYLNNFLFIFLDKLNGIRASRKELPPAGEDNAVVIKKIKMLHAE